MAKINKWCEFRKLMKVYEILSSSYIVDPKLVDMVRSRMTELQKLIDVLIEHPEANYTELYNFYKNI